jgi:uncharacterized membrane protein YccC
MRLNADSRTKRAIHKLQPAVSSAAVWRAVRCATSTGIPALLGTATGNGDFGWAALGGFEATLADLGGSYRARFTAMGLLSLAGACGLFLGMISNGHFWLLLLCTLIWSFIWAYAGVLGGTVNAFNVIVIVIFLCGIETHIGLWTQAVQHALYLLGGGMWATLLSLFLWPVHPYRPARTAVAACYSGLSSMISSTLSLLRREEAPAKLWHRVARIHQYEMRNSLETARTVIAATRAQQLAENVRGEQLLVLLETADVMLSYAISATEHAEHIHSNPRLRERLTGFLEQWRELLVWVSNTATSGSPTEPLLNEQREKMRRMAAQARTTGDSFFTHLVVTTADAMDVALTAVFTARTGLPLETGAAVPIGPSHRTISLPSRSMWRTLCEAWSWESVTLRHALRVSVVCTLGILISGLLHLHHGYWIAMTSVIVMRPNLATTSKRSLQRILGSVAGGMLAAVLLFLIRSKSTLALLLFPLSFATMASLPVNYGLFVFFLTPTFVIVSASYAGDWQLAITRVIDTVTGAVLALPAMYSLWPVWQHEGFRELLAREFRSDVDYFETLEHSWRSPGSIGPVEIARARRQTGLSNNAAEEALDQLLNEPKTAPEMREPAATFVTYARRLAQSVTALHNQPPQSRSGAELAHLSELGLRLNQIIDALCTGKFQPSLPALPRVDDPSSEQFEVLDRQIQILETATVRLVNPGSESADIPASEAAQVGA